MPCLGGIFEQSFFRVIFPLSLLYKLWYVSFGVSMEKSFVGVFCLLDFLVCVVSSGDFDAGSSVLLDFGGAGALRVRTLGSSSGFGGVSALFFFFG